MKPMLAHVFKGASIQSPFFVQPKLNGIRGLYQNGRFWSRDEIPWHDEVIQHVADELVQVIPLDWILDGEFYRHGWSLQQINAAIAVKRFHKTPQTPQISFNVFDIVSVQPFPIRFATVVPLLRDLKNSFSVRTHICETLEQSTNLFCFYRRQGYEGIMYRHGNEGYVSKRCNHLLKRKAWFDSEFRIVGLEEGIGKCSNTLGALICITADEKRFRVGTGFDDATRKTFFIDPPIGQLATVQFIGWSDAGIPLNTSFQGLRE